MTVELVISGSLAATGTSGTTSKASPTRKVSQTQRQRGRIGGSKLLTASIDSPCDRIERGEKHQENPAVSPYELDVCRRCEFQRARSLTSSQDHADHKSKPTASKTKRPGDHFDRRAIATVQVSSSGSADDIHMRFRCELHRIQYRQHLRAQ